MKTDVKKLKKLKKEREKPQKKLRGIGLRRFGKENKQTPSKNEIVKNVKQSKTKIVEPIIKNRESTTKNVNPVVLSRYELYIQNIKNITNIKQLKKIIYNRNYKLTKNWEKKHPELAEQHKLLKFPPVKDIRIVSKATFRRLNKIKDDNKLIQELQRIIIDNTRRNNKPKKYKDYSNKEQLYLENAVNNLIIALTGWLKNLDINTDTILQNINFDNISKIFEIAPSYWAISSGYYYAVENFDDFVNEIIKLIELNGAELNDSQKGQLYDTLFHNEPIPT